MADSGDGSGLLPILATEVAAVGEGIDLAADRAALQATRRLTPTVEPASLWRAKPSRPGGPAGTFQARQAITESDQ